MSSFYVHNVILIENFVISIRILLELFLCLEDLDKLCLNQT